MIIKNNFNSRNANPLNNYKPIGKGENSQDENIDLDNEKNFDNSSLDNNLNENEYDSEDFDNDSGDKWSFFK